MRKVICKNSDGLSINFTDDKFSPWLLNEVDGVYQVKERVETSDNKMTDGSTYQGSTAEERNIVLTLTDAGDHQRNRQLLYDVFKVKDNGIFRYSEGSKAYTIKYIVEAVDIQTTGLHRTATISLICPDPFFESTEDINVQIAGWGKFFTFPHIFKLEAFGGKSGEKLKNIENDSAADGVGITITITATGEVKNPSITRVESNQTIKVGNAAHPLTMVTGDIVTITTGVGNKHVYFTHDGEKKEINEYLDEASWFIQLMRGKNTIGYNADSGADYMTVMVTFRYKFPGV